VESETESTVRGFTTPGAAVTPPLRSTEDDEIIEMERFRSFVGRIMFACGKTEPCISNACRELTSHLTAPNEEHWKSLDHLIGYLKGGTHHGMKMRAPLGRQIVVFVDSDYASDRNDRKSISGHLVTIGGCLVSWQSKKQTGVTLSSTEAEFVAMSTAATEIKFVVSLLTEIHGTAPTMPSILKEDNTGAIFMAKNTAIGQRTKHVDVRHRFVNDMVLNGELFVDHIRSEENPSDAMTKNLPLPLHAKHVRVISEGKLGSLYDSTTTEDVKVYASTMLPPYGARSNDAVEQCNSATVRHDECPVVEYNGIDRDISDANTSTSPGHCDGWTMVHHNKAKSKTRRLTKSDKTWQSVNEIGAVEPTEEQDQVKALLNADTISVGDLIRVSSMSERSILFGIEKKTQENGMGPEWDQNGTRLGLALE
jgi:hypothetical protein